MSDDIKLNIPDPYSTSNNDAFTFSLNENESPSTGMTDFKGKLEELKKKMEDSGVTETPKPSKPLKFPLHDQDQYPCEVKFKILLRDPPSVQGLGNAVSEAIETLGDINKAGVAAASEEYEESGENPIGAGAGYVDGAVTEIVNKLDASFGDETITAEDSLNAVGDAVNAVKTGGRPDIGKNISLYLPGAYAVSDALQYGTFEFGAMGAAGLAALQGGGSVMESIKAMLFDGAGSVVDAITGNAGASEYASLSAIRGMGMVKSLAGPAGDVATSAVKLTMGVTINPNTRAMFKAVGLRSFQLQFKFIPLSEKEAKQTEEIIKRFREHAYPESIDVGGVSQGYKYPHMFEIEMLAYGKPVGTKIKPCVLESISTNYNPSGMTYYKGEDRSYPAEYTLSLSFREDITLNAQDIRDGF